MEITNDLLRKNGFTLLGFFNSRWYKETPEWTITYDMSSRVFIMYGEKLIYDIYPGNIIQDICTVEDFNLALKVSKINESHFLKA